MTKGLQIQLTFDQLYEAFDKSLDNAIRLHGAGVTLLPEFQDISLGLFELGQEELGKSYTCLATMAVKKGTVEFWKGFWRAWRHHNIKAHRAFFYEWLSPIRIAVISPDGRKSDGLPSRTKIEHEKEFSFYVNFNEKQQQFTSPFQNVTRAEITNRACALTYLIFIAITVKETLDIGERERNYKTFSIIPFRIFTKFILQEDIPKLYRKFSVISAYHNSLISRLEEAFSNSKGELESMLKKASSQSVS